MLLSAQQSDLLRLLAFIYLQHGKTRQAAVLFQALHVLHPLDAAVTRSLACALLRTDQPAEALALLDPMLLHGEATALSELLRAQALASLGRPEQAAAAMQQFVHLRNAGAGAARNAAGG